MEYCDQKQISEDIAGTGKCHRDERGPGISDGPEYAADQIVPGDDKHPSPADLQILHRITERFLRNFHD